MPHLDIDTAKAASGTCAPAETDTTPLAQVGAWLDDELDLSGCASLCTALSDSAPADAQDVICAALEVQLIGRALRDEPFSITELGRSQRILSGVRAAYTPSPTQSEQLPNLVQPKQRITASANNHWFSRSALGGCLVVVLSAGLWSQWPTAQDATTLVAVVPATLPQSLMATSGATELARLQPSSTPRKTLIRDPHLDALLATHRQTGASNTWPGAVGFVRNVAWSGAGQ